MDLDIEIFTHKARISALKQRVVDQEDFIERCQQRQRSSHWKTQGLIPASTYDSLLIYRWGKHKKKSSQRVKSDKWHNFFCWSDPAMFPCTIIKHAEERIAVLEQELAEFKRLRKEQSNG